MTATDFYCGRLGLVAWRRGGSGGASGWAGTLLALGAGATNAGAAATGGATGVGAAAGPGTGSASLRPDCGGAAGRGWRWRAAAAGAPPLVAPPPDMIDDGFSRLAPASGIGAQ
ncbi:MAG: hypothetical protein ING63_02575 [Rhodocyclaceae bacterium]|nr:hypothetical protein [Rhodocyclaceae bacterium]